MRSVWNMSSWRGLAEWEKVRERLKNAGYTTTFTYTGDQGENTLSLGYVRSGYSGTVPETAQGLQRAEDAFELNALFQVTPFIAVQPVVQEFLNASGGLGSATVVGFHANVTF